MLDWLVEFVSGEKLLDWLEKPNGGIIIFLRSLWVSAFMFFAAL